MPSKRARTSTSGKSTARRRYVKKTKRDTRMAKYGIYRSMGSLYSPNNVYNIVRTMYKPLAFQLPPVSALPSGAPATLFFSLNQLPDFADFTSMFDQYMIDKVQVTVIPRFVASTQPVANPPSTIPLMLGGALLGSIHSAIDYDDAIQPADRDEILQFQNHQSHRADQQFTRTLSPRVKSVVSISGGTTAVAAAGTLQKMWIDVTSNNIAHNGVKLWFDAANYDIAAGSINYDLKVKYFLRFKNVR